MVKVPTYSGGGQQLRAINQTPVRVNASADSFGGGLGRGLGAVGEGLGQAASAMSAMQELEDTTRAKEADNAYASWVRESMYGDGGFLTQSGRNAVDGRAAFEAQAAEKRAEFGAGLTPGAQRSYETASTARLQQVLNSSITHTANERKTWVAEASASRLNTFSEDAVAAYADPAKVAQSVAAGQAELRQQGQLMGWDADTLANREAEYVSEVRLNTGLRMLAEDPEWAKMYYDQWKDQITGPHQYRFEEALKVPLLNATVVRRTGEFFGAGGQAAAGGDYYANIRAAESGGDDAARNPNSSATGRYQFTAGTWADMARKYPSLGLTPGGITDPEQQERAIRQFTADNERALARGGVNITNGTRYAAHFLGAGDAVKVLRADPNAQVSSIVSERVINANSFLRGMSVADFAEWAEGKGGSGGAGRSGGGAPSVSSIEPYLQTIQDPTERDMTRKAIYAQIDAQSKAQAAEQTALQQRAFELIETNNVSPFDLPPDITTAIGMENMSQLMTYWEKRSSGTPIQTDPQLLYDMQTLYATDPQRFAQENLLQYRNSLSDSDWNTVNGWRQTALTDQTKARTEGAAITTAFSQARTALDGVGISTTDLKGSAKQEMAQREARFQMALADEMRAFQEANQKAPTEMEVQSMVNRLLLPIVIKTPRAGGWLGTSEQDAFSFEAGFRADGTTVDVAVEYDDIPIDLRRGIKADLERELGRPVSDEEVIARYEEVALSR